MKLNRAVIVGSVAAINAALIVTMLAAAIVRRTPARVAINALAPLLLCRALLPSLATGSRVALITSRMGSLDDNSSGAYYGYRMSKAALNMAGRSLAVDLRAREIAVAVLHPGMVATRMVGFSGIPPEQAARGLLERIDALTLESSGRFWHANGEPLPW